MLTLEEIGELFGNPEKFFQRPEREGEGAIKVLMNVLPFALVFCIGATILSMYFNPGTDVLLIIVGLLVMLFLGILMFLSLAIPLKLFGHSFFRTYQAFAYGLVPFLLAGWLIGFVVILSFFSTYWGICVLQKTSKAKAIAVMIVPILLAVFSQQMVFLAGMGISMFMGGMNAANYALGASEGSLVNGTYSNEFYGFSLSLPQEAVIKEDGAYFYFTWIGTGGASVPMELYIHGGDTFSPDLEGFASELERICEEKPDCMPISQTRIRFLGYDSFEIMEGSLLEGIPVVEKGHIFYVEGGKYFYISCTLFEENYDAGIAECEQVASTFRYTK